MENEKEKILNLKHGEHYIVPESDYGKAEVWFINDVYILFEIPTYGGAPYYSNVYSKCCIDDMIKEYRSWT